MIRLLDGPAEGTYAVKRAPAFLRAVVGPSGNDLLDQLNDTPAADEVVHVYRIRNDGPKGWVQVCRGPGSGRFAIGEYTHLADVDGELLRDTAAWRSWCRATADTELRELEAAV